MNRTIPLAALMAASALLAGASWLPSSTAQDAKQSRLTSKEINPILWQLHEIGLNKDEIAALKLRLEKIELTGRDREKRLKELAEHAEFRAILKELQQRFAYQNLENRLAFEKDKTKLDGKLDQSALDRLRQLESMLRNRGREAALKNLHDDKVARFVSAQGFGVERTILPRRTEPSVELLTLANAKTLPPARAGKPASLPATNQGAGGPRTMPALNELSWMHLRGQIDFLGRLGVAKERRVAAGFGSHALHDVPRLSTKAVKNNDKERWLVRRVELVSLLMHEKPAVYLTGDVPRMDQLANIKTRPIDDFETRAIASLRKGEDVVADATTNSIRMVGSIRATKQCLECHNTERGALLGAFSYRLERDPPALGK